MAQEGITTPFCSLFLFLFTPPPRRRFTANVDMRSWDLLPHSDTIRDIPYLLKDWARRVIGTLQGRSSGRGGYSAV